MTQAPSTRDSTAIFLGDAPASSSTVSDYVQLTKPRITLMVVIMAGIGFAFGVGGQLPGALPVAWQWGAFGWMLLGTALSCMGASALNQFLEVDTDAKMQRTANRPLPAGRVSPRTGLLVGVVMSVAGVAALAFGCNVLAAGICAFVVLSYALLYTPMKRVSPLALEVGAVPGALPPVLGYAAAAGQIDAVAWVLFGIMFVWQLPHFQAIAWLYREDYTRAGMAMLPVLDPSGHRTFRQILVTTLVLVPLGLVPSAMGESGLFAFIVAMVCGLGFAAFAVALVVRPSRKRARRLFLASLAYLPLVFAAMVLDRT